VHVVVALARPAVKAFDLAIPAEIFGDGAIGTEQYSFSVCAPAAGPVPYLADPLTAARVHEARRLLEVSDLPVEEIARRSGLGSPANLRVHLARDAGTTPTAYRAAYQGHQPNS
jgi:Helix-turn-helix domain